MQVTRILTMAVAGLVAAGGLSAAPAYRGQLTGPTTVSSYGISVATDGHWVAIGGSNNVDFLTWTGSDWKLISRVSIKGMPTSLAIYKDIALAKTSDGVIAFDNINGSWVRTQELSFPDAGSTYYGNSIALLSYTAVVGTPHYGSDRGAMYVIRRNTPTGPWVTVQGFANPLSGADNFGASVALSGIGGQHYLLVSAPYFNGGAGRVYAFLENATTHNFDPAGILSSPSGNAVARFGESVSAAGANVLVGAPADNGFLGSARQYAVSIAGGGFNATLTQTLSSQVSASLFGEGVILTGSTALISSRTTLAWYPVTSGLLGPASQLFTGPVVGAFGTAVASAGGFSFAGNPGGNSNYGFVLWYQ